MRRTIRNFCVHSLAFAVISSIGAAFADTTAPESHVVALTNTDWSQNLVFAKFDPALGTLTRVDFSLEGHVVGSAKFENTGASASTVTMQLKADITLTRPDSSLLVTTIPIANTSDNVSAFDGTNDFGGTSGRTYNNLAATLTNVSFTMSGADLALFTGPGSVTLPISAKGTSNATGSGSIITQFSTQAGATATIFYTFTVVPEPASIALTAIGGIGFLALFRKRITRKV